MPTEKKTDEVEKTPRYAVYDNTLLRFTGAVHEKKADAEAAKKNGPSGHELEVREV